MYLVVICVKSKSGVPASIADDQNVLVSDGLPLTHNVIKKLLTVVTVIPNDHLQPPSFSCVGPKACMALHGIVRQ